MPFAKEDIRKLFEVYKNMPITRKTAKQIADDHRILHAWWASLQKGKVLKHEDHALINKKEIVTKHAAAVRWLLDHQELFKNGYTHRMSDTLDDTLPEQLKNAVPESSIASLKPSLHSIFDATRRLADNRPYCLPKGKKGAKIAVIGEAPGKTECSTKEPFSGPTAKILNYSLNASGLKRSDCYLTNVYKIRIEDVKEHEKKAWRQLLALEIKFLKPKTIIALGATAQTALPSMAKIAAPHPSSARFSYRSTLKRIKEAFSNAARKIRP